MSSNDRLSDELLARLAAYDETTDEIHPPIFLWHQVPFDPANQAHVDYARVAGGVVVDLAQPDTWEAGAELAEKTGTILGVGVHPCKKGMGWSSREARNPLVWGDRWSREMARLAGLADRLASKVGPILRIFIDSERWKRDARQADDRRAWNEAITFKHDQIANIFGTHFTTARIEFFGMNPQNRCCSFRENTRVASMSLYGGGYHENHPKLMETIEWSLAGDRWDSVTTWIAMGMRHYKGEWDDGTLRDEHHAWQLGRLIGQSQIGRRVHTIINYLFGWNDPRNADHARHFGALLLGLRGLPVDGNSNDDN